MLTPQQIQSVAANNGLKVVNPNAGQPISQAAQDFAKRVGYDPNAQSLGQKIKTGYSAYSDEVNKVATGIFDPLKEAGQKVNEDIHSNQNVFGKIADTTGDIAGGVVKSIFSPLEEVIRTSPGGGVKDKPGSLAEKEDQKISEFWNNLKQSHPQVAKKLADAGNVVNFALLGMGDNEPVKNAAGDVVDKTIAGAKDLGDKAFQTADTVAGKTIDKVGNIKGKVLPTKDPIQETISAVDPKLSGKKLTGAYKQIVTGSREGSRSGIVGEQTLSPSQQAINIGTRLSKPVEGVREIPLGKDPLENLHSLKQGLEETESALEPLLEKDVTTGTKDELWNTLDELKKNMPREYKGIKDSGTTFENVVDFAKDMVEKGEESTKGFREARSSFDHQAQKEFPSAYNDAGYIDQKTPAGRAIKLVRDTINEYNYSHASGGDPIQNLIERESDIFRATDSIAPKAAKLHSTGVIARFYKEHPMMGGILKRTLNALRLGEAINITDIAH